MDEMKKDQAMGHGDMCHCGMYANGMGHMHGHFGFWVARLLVALVVLLFVFWLGVKVGEVKSYMGGRYDTGRNMMYRQGGAGFYVTPGTPMMNIAPGSTTTTLPKATTTPVK